MTDLDRAMMPDYVKNITPKGFINPPSSKVRNVAEWEEMDAIVLSWQSYPDHLTEIVRAAVEECQVYILTQNSSSVNSTLINAGVDVTNVHYINTPTNSVWIRDFGPNNIYTNDVDSLLFVDWIYNRPSRPDDDASPAAVASTMNIPLYETTQAPTDLVNTGGNFFSDGFGTAFATELILEENQSGNPYGVTAKTEADIDTIMKHFMGIDRFIKFTVLPYDGIHHIDMHMKMLDEETLLVGEYPTGVADGPQIEANLQYLQNNFMSVFGTPYRIIRIPNPPSPSGLYPDNGGYYRTYTNSLIINKTIIVPTYYEEYDTTALRIYREAMPGYKIVGIDCDDNYGPIAASGAIHCITHEIAAQNPVLISHKRLEDTNNIWTPYQVDAKILNKSGIAGATVYYTTDTLQPFQAASMTFTDPITNTWTGYIPAQPSGTRVYYYIEATSNNGKTMVRPMPAPNGWWSFKVENPTDVEQYDDNIIKITSYYNQSGNEICVFTQDDINCNISLYDILGKKINTIYQGTILKGKNTFPVKNNVNAGCYNLVLSSGDIRITKHIFLQ
ncbi:MAG: hypothetical protein Kow0068_02430 [Marinilabiliales bacterium]